MQLLSFIAPHRAALCASTCARHSACPRAGRVSAARRARVGFKGCLKIRTSSKVCSVFSTSKFVLPPTCVGVHDRSVVWSGVRMRGNPPRCVTSKSIRLDDGSTDEFCDACQGRVETVLDRFSHGQVVGTTEHFARVSSRIEPARLLRFTRFSVSPFSRKNPSSVRLPPLESDDYPEGVHYFLEYQIFKRDPENYHDCFEIEFLV